MSHPLAQVLSSTAEDILTAISHGRRSVIDTKGKLAELYLHRILTSQAFAEVEWVEKDGQPDFKVRVTSTPWHFRDYKIECKNIRSSAVGKPGDFKVELQKTRHSKTGKTPRGYRNDHFHILAVCLFNRTGNWTYLFHATNTLPTDPTHPGYLQKMLPVPADLTQLGTWRTNIFEAIEDYEHACIQRVSPDQRTTNG